MNNCKHNRSAHWRDTRDAVTVLYHWRAWHCAAIESTVNAATNNTRCN